VLEDVEDDVAGEQETMAVATGRVRVKVRMSAQGRTAPPSPKSRLWL
jgi:hypothetical protein